jgi:hypothetical protein
MVRIWLITLLLWPVLAAGEPSTVPEARQTDEVGAPEQEVVQGDPDDSAVTWVDSSHAYATDQVQGLTAWMDNFFGDPTYDLETPDSLVRMEWRNTWDREDGHKARVRVRGKLHMPRISKRLNLLFNEEDGDELGADERKENTDLVGLQYSLGELNRSRVDLTLDAGTWDLRPGVRYRNQGPIAKQMGYRFTQQLEYKDGEGFYSTTEVNLDRVLDENSLLRWSNRLIHGEETDGEEWQTILSLDQRQRPLHKKHQFVIGYFGAIEGVTDPDYVQNYRMGMVFRRQVYRPFFFVELEPSYNLRRDSPEQSRSGAWNIVLRFEIVLQPDLARRWRDSVPNSKAPKTGPPAAGQGLPPPASTAE